MTRKGLLKEYLAMVLVGVESGKTGRGIEPHFTTGMELKAELQGDLETAILEMEEAGMIHRGRTLNDDYIALI